MYYIFGTWVDGYGRRGMKTIFLSFVTVFCAANCGWREQPLWWRRLYKNWLAFSLGVVAFNLWLSWCYRSLGTKGWSTQLTTAIILVEKQVAKNCIISFKSEPGKSFLEKVLKSGIIIASCKFKSQPSYLKLSVKTKILSFKPSLSLIGVDNFFQRQLYIYLICKLKKVKSLLTSRVR